MENPKKMNDLDDEDLDLSENIEIKFEDIRKQNSTKLCDIIVCERYLSFDKELALKCMEELSSRRINGDSFDFETYIENAGKDLPALNFSLPDFNSIVRQIGKKIE